MKKDIKMKNNNLRFTFFALTAIFCVTLVFPYSVSAQRRDHLTEMETELVREMQEIDKRTEIYIKALERRFLVLNKDSSQSKKVEKDLDKWGELPVGNRTQLLLDIEKILQEAVDNIDNVAEHDMKSELLPKAVRVLAEASNRFLPQFKAFLDSAQSDKEKGAMIGAIDYCNQIIEASTKLPKEEKKKKKS